MAAKQTAEAAVQHEQGVTRTKCSPSVCMLAHYIPLRGHRWTVPEVGNPLVQLPAAAVVVVVKVIIVWHLGATLRVLSLLLRPPRIPAKVVAVLSAPSTVETPVALLRWQ